MAAALGTTPPMLTGAFRAARRTAVEAAAFSLFVNVLMLTGPLYMLQIYDRVLSSQSYETLVVITLLVVALFSAMALLDYARSALLARTAGAFEDTLKELTFDMTMDASRVGINVAEQPLRDLRQIRQFVASPALIAVFDAPWAPAFLAVVFMMHWLLGLVALAGLIALAILALINERSSRGANASAATLASEADRHAMASIRNSAAADAMGMRATLRARWLRLSDEANGFLISSTDTIGGLTAASKALRLFLQSAILGTGAYLAILGEATPGVMIAASIIAGRALAPIEIVTSQWKNFALAAVAFRRLKLFVEKFPARSERTALPAPKGAVSVERVYCQPGGAKQPVLKNISFNLAPGEALGIVGPSAAGKSTLARAIVGVEACAAGVIRMDGANLTHWDQDALGKYIGYLPQEVELFAGTAAQNIARFRDDASPKDIIDAAEAAGAHQMIQDFPEGYDTEIGDRGARLSAGQRQRLGLARALYADPVLVVLDEPNANLDAEGEAALTGAIKGLKARGATVVIIAHRPSAIAFVDKLLFLVGGETRGFGPRDDVLTQIAPKQVAVLRRVASEDGAANG